MKLICKLATLTLLVASMNFALADIGPSNRSCSVNAAGTLQSGSCDKFFVKVKNGESSATIASGAPVILDYSDDNGYVVISSSTARDIPFCVMAESCAAAETDCDCQTYGLMTDFQFDADGGAATAGHHVYLSENFASYGMAMARTSVDALDNPIGVFYDSPSASADVEVFIKLR